MNELKSQKMQARIEPSERTQVWKLLLPADDFIDGPTIITDLDQKSLQFVIDIAKPSKDFKEILKIMRSEISIWDDMEQKHKPIQIANDGLEYDKE